MCSCSLMHWDSYIFKQRNVEVALSKGIIVTRRSLWVIHQQINKPGEKPRNWVEAQLKLRNVPTQVLQERFVAWMFSSTAVFGTMRSQFHTCIDICVRTVPAQVLKGRFIGGMFRSTAVFEIHELEVLHVHRYAY